MTSIAPDQLSRSLQRGLAAVYLLSGDETLLLQEAADSIRAAARSNGFTERELYHVGNDFDWNLLLTSVNSLSLFAERKIYELRFASGKIDDAGNKALQHYCERPPEDNLLLITFPKISKGQQRSKWYQAIDACGSVVQVWPVSPQQLPAWLDNRIRQAGLRADPDTIDLLAARTEGNLLAAAQEIEKLKLLCQDGFISADLVAGSVADSARYDVFSLVDKALHGDARAAVKSLHGLRGEGTDATVVLWALAREIRILSQIAHGVENGQSFDRVARSCGVWDKRKQLVSRAARRLKSSQLQLLLRKANSVDKTIKGLRQGDAWDELMDLTLNLSGTFSLSPQVQKLSLTLNY